jgi:hypothetical protein
MSLGIQKAPVWKRISAFLFDIMLVISLALVFLIGFSTFLNFDKYSDTLTSKLTSYEQQYEVPTYTDEEFEIDSLVYATASKEIVYSIAYPQEEEKAYCIWHYNYDTKESGLVMKSKTFAMI